MAGAVKGMYLASEGIEEMTPFLHFGEHQSRPLRGEAAAFAVKLGRKPFPIIETQFPEEV
jgi:hypothetical protein